VSDTSRSASLICTICYKKACWGEWALSMVRVEVGREFRFRRDLHSQESTFPLVTHAALMVGRRCRLTKKRNIQHSSQKSQISGLMFPQVVHKHKLGEVGK